MGILILWICSLHMQVFFLLEIRIFAWFILINCSINVLLFVTDPPTTPEFYIKNTKVSGRVKVIRNNEVSITCSSSGKPDQIEYTWKHNKETTFGAVLTTSSIVNDDQYTCEVKNSMNPSNGSVVPGKNSSSISFEVLCKF